MRQINALFTIAFRDFIKLLRDRTRIIASLLFPFIFIGVLGTSFDASYGANVGFNMLAFIFTGVLAQTLFQSTASGVISLIEDRENDFSQEIFVSPISRYTIIFGKILGETLVSFTQVIGVLLFGLIMGVQMPLPWLISLIPVGFIICAFGGAFGVLVLANLSNQRSANQIFPFIIFPQIFLSGVFNPLTTLPPILSAVSQLMPMTYAVDFMRSLYYAGDPVASKIVLHAPTTNLLIIGIFFVIMFGIGTFLFVKNERNK